MVDVYSWGIVDFYDVAHQFQSSSPPPTPNKNYKPIFHMHQDDRIVREIQPKDSLRTPTGHENWLSNCVSPLPQSLEGGVRNQQTAYHYVHVYRLIHDSLHIFRYIVMHALIPLYHHVLITLLCDVCLVFEKDGVLYISTWTFSHSLDVSEWYVWGKRKSYGENGCTNNVGTCRTLFIRIATKTKWPPHWIYYISIGYMWPSMHKPTIHRKM